MSDTEQPGAPDAQKAPDTRAPGASGAGGKLIGKEVFLSRLAARQEAVTDVDGRARALSTLEEAFKALGIASDGLGSRLLSGSHTRDASTSTEDSADVVSLEALAVEELFLSELRAGRRPRLGEYLQRYPDQRIALLRLAARLDPHDLVGDDAPDEIAPESRAAADRGLVEGELRALRALVSGAAPGKRRRGRRVDRHDTVAEERAPYDASAADNPPDAPGTSHARPARPEDSGPER